MAQAQGVDIQKVRDAAEAVRTQATKDQIAQAVKDGTMTQDHADWLLQGLDKGYLNGPFGFFGGPGGRHGGPGTGPMGGNPPAAPSTPATPAPGTTG